MKSGDVIPIQFGIIRRNLYRQRVMIMKCVREIGMIMKMTFPSPIDVIKGLPRWVQGGVVNGTIIANIRVGDGHGRFTRITKVEC